MEGGISCDADIFDHSSARDTAIAFDFQTRIGGVNNSREIALARQFNRLARARKPFPLVETLPDSARRLELAVPQG